MASKSNSFKVGRSRLFESRGDKPLAPDNICSDKAELARYAYAGPSHDATLACLCKGGRLELLNWTRIEPKQGLAFGQGVSLS